MRAEKTRILVLCAMAVVINVVLGEAVSALKIPLLFLDTLGTIFISAAYGMGYGVLTGVSTNLLMGVVGGASAIPFALVSAAVAVTVSLCRKFSHGRFPLPAAVVAGLLLSVICPMIGAPIRLALFGGLTGSGTDILIMALRQSGKDMISATYWGAVAGNFADKLVSSVLVSLLLNGRLGKLLLQGGTGEKREIKSGR